MILVNDSPEMASHIKQFLERSLHTIALKDYFKFLSSSALVYSSWYLWFPANFNLQLHRWLATLSWLFLISCLLLPSKFQCIMICTYTTTMQSLDTSGTYEIWGLGESLFTIWEYLKEDRKINTALVKQSPQKQLPLSFIYFYRVYFSYIQRCIYLLWDLGLHLFSQMAQENFFITSCCESLDD